MRRQKTFELDLRANPLYQPGKDKYWEPISAMLKTYSRDDPPTRPHLAVPVPLPEYLLKQARDPRVSAYHEAVADLINIAFYFLLRVSEYTKPRSHKQHTHPFHIKNHCHVKTTSQCQS